MNHSPDEVSPSTLVVVTLTLFWVGMLTWTLLIAADTWPPPRGPEYLVFGGWQSVTAAFGEAARQIGPRIAVVLAAVAAAPVFLCTWIALPPWARRTFPAVLVLWIALVLAATGEWWPTTDRAVFGLTCASVLLTAEVLRALLTMLVRHGTRPLDSRAPSV